MEIVYLVKLGLHELLSLYQKFCSLTKIPEEFLNKRLAPKFINVCPSPQKAVPFSKFHYSPNTILKDATSRGERVEVSPAMWARSRAIYETYRTTHQLEKDMFGYPAEAWGLAV